jgi:putative transcriptional regulator
LVAIKAAEKGKAKLSTLVAILRALSALDDIDRFIQPITISPLQLAKTQGKPRKRATGK